MIFTINYAEKYSVNMGTVGGAGGPAGPCAVVLMPLQCVSRHRSMIKLSIFILCLA